MSNRLEGSALILLSIGFISRLAFLMMILISQRAAIVPVQLLLHFLSLCVIGIGVFLFAQKNRNVMPLIAIWVLTIPLISLLMAITNLFLLDVNISQFIRLILIRNSISIGAATLVFFSLIKQHNILRVLSIVAYLFLIVISVFTFVQTLLNILTFNIPNIISYLLFQGLMLISTIFVILSIIVYLIKPFEQDH